MRQPKNELDRPRTVTRHNFVYEKSTKVIFKISTILEHGNLFLPFEKVDFQSNMGHLQKIHHFEFWVKIHRSQIK
jgi:hypothetical protein